MFNAEKKLKQKFNNLNEKFKTVYSRSQVETLLGELNSLQNEALSYGLSFDISHLQKAAEVKVKNFEIEQSINRSQTQEEEFLQKQRLARLAEEEREITQKIATLNNFHNEFIQKINKDIKRIEKSNKRLDKIITKLEKENTIDHEELNREILTHEEILAQHQDHKQHYERQKIINEEYVLVSTELSKLNKEITNLKQQLQKKDLQPEDIEELQGELKLYQDILKVRKVYSEQLSKDKKENDQKIAKYEQNRIIKSDKIEKFGNKIKERYKKAPEKYLEAYEKYIALKNQHEAVGTNGIVKDVEHHNKVLTNINAYKTKTLADKMRKQTPVKGNNTRSLLPSRTPSNFYKQKMRGLYN